MNFTGWLTGASLFTAAIGIWVAVWTLRADHTRSRSATAVDLMRFWYEVIRKDHLLIPSVRLADTLDNENLDRLFSGRELTLTGDAGEYAKIIANSRSFQFESAKDGTVTIGREAVFFIRQQVISYLNALEILAAAWNDAIIDAETFEREFRSVFFPYNNDPPLTKFINRSGIFPTANEAIGYLKEKSRKIERRSNAA